MKSTKGITLIALVITIIVLLILAGITINLTIGEHGILTMAKEAGKNYQNAAEYEQGAIGKFFNEAQNIIAGGNGTGTNPEENDKPEEPGPWLLASKVKVGDYVAYDPTAGVTDTSKLTYISPKGTGMSHGNGYEIQTFTARATDRNGETLKWKVLKSNPETGEVVLVNYSNIVPEEDYHGLYLVGAIGYLYMEEELNLACSIFGYGKGADTSKTFTYQTGDVLEGLTTGKITGSGARSMKTEDVNEVTGFEFSNNDFKLGRTVFRSYYKQCYWNYYISYKK